LHIRPKRRFHLLGAMIAAHIVVLLCALSPAVAAASAVQLARGAAVAAGHASSKTGSQERANRTNPELKPESDAKFFKKDYPDDLRPGVTKRFGFTHPYPAVQDSEDYARDFVKDENNDGGEWKAQMEYDNLRSKLQREYSDVIASEKNDAKEKHEFEEAQNANKKAEQEKAQAEQKAEAARKRARETADALKRFEDEIQDAINKVEAEIKDLEGCKEKLAVARQQLKELMATKKQLEIKHRETMAIHDAVEASEKQRLANLPKESPESETREKVDKMKRDIAVKEHETEIDGRSYEDQLKRIEATRAELDKAAARLRSVRKKEVDPNGGVYHTDEKAAQKSPGLYFLRSHSGSLSVGMASFTFTVFVTIFTSAASL